MNLFNTIYLFTLYGLIHTASVSLNYETDTNTFYVSNSVKPLKGSKEEIARSYFKNEINETGWAYLNVYTSDIHPDEQQSYGAGWVEGYMTRDLISMHWQNTYKHYCSKPFSKFCSQLQSYLVENTKWVQMMVEQSPDDAYWQQVKLFYYQYSGLIDGYYNRTSYPRFQIDIDDLFLFQIAGDLEDLSSALHKDGYSRIPGDGHCSALVKLLPENKDLFVAQDTWTGFNGMLRILKKYDFAFLGTNTMTFSSYPGVLMSGDDFYVMSNGLVSMETTIGNGNASRWEYVHPEGSVLEGIRSLVANRLAKDGKQWCELFSSFNSGTYNNQWMLVDFNKFKPGKQPQANDGLLYVAEQLPGLIVYEDITDVLVSQGYFASYNTPYFPKIFNASGGPAMVAKYGDWFTYEHTPRANIFRRDHVKVTDIDSMTKLLRYNNFEHDPLSACNCTPPYSAENAISARCDLNPKNGTYPFSALGHRLHGGIDMKLTTFELQNTMDFVAVSSPTFDDLPPFQWSKSDFEKTVSHIGHPDVWNFKPITTNWSQPMFDRYSTAQPISVNNV